MFLPFTVFELSLKPNETLCTQSKMIRPTYLNTWSWTEHCIHPSVELHWKCPTLKCTVEDTGMHSRTKHRDLPVGSLWCLNWAGIYTWSLDYCNRSGCCSHSDRRKIRRTCWRCWRRDPQMAEVVEGGNHWTLGSCWNPMGSYWIPMDNY